MKLYFMISFQPVWSLGILILTYIAGFVFHVIVEAPFVNLSKLLQHTLIRYADSSRARVTYYKSDRHMYNLLIIVFYVVAIETVTK